MANSTKKRKLLNPESLEKYLLVFLLIILVIVGAVWLIRSNTSNAVEIDNTPSVVENKEQ